MNGVLSTVRNCSVAPTDIYLLVYLVFTAAALLKYIFILFKNTHDSSDAVYDSNSH